MRFELMCLEVHLGLENHKLLLQASLVEAEKMIDSKVLFQRVVVNVILRLAASAPSIADMTTLVLVSAMSIQLVIAIKPYVTESAFRVALEPTLVDGARSVVSEPFVSPKAAGGE
jgi:hypothetical protein